MQHDEPVTIYATYWAGLIELSAMAMISSGLDFDPSDPNDEIMQYARDLCCSYIRSIWGVSLTPDELEIDIEEGTYWSLEQ